MRIRLDASQPFDLGTTLCCGQTFRWEKRGEWYCGVVRNSVFKVRQVGDELEFEGTGFDFIRNYLGLNDNLQEIFRQIGKDEYILAAIKKFEGLRILRQDPWECLISYICATNKSIPAIEQMLSSLSQRFGDRVQFHGYGFYSFPRPEKLARASLTELRKCSLGYRADRVQETARIVYENSVQFEHLKRASYEQAKTELLRFPGVGPKVADCVLLFSLGKLEAFPIDVWVKRLILKYYSSHFAKEFITRILNKRTPTPKEYEKLNLFGREYFGQYAGYAQEYLFHYERTWDQTGLL